LNLPTIPILEDFDITKESIKNSTIEEFLGKCSLLVETDIKAFMMLLESQGYDFWFEKVAYPTYVPEPKSGQGDDGPSSMI
jgi:hypothetical protein